MTNQRSIFLTLGGLVLLLGLLAFQLLVRSTSFLPVGSRFDVSDLNKPKTPTITPDKPNDPWTGSSSTEAIVVTVYGDMTDMATRSLEPAIVSLLQSSIPVRIVWKDAVIASERPDAILVAAAGKCAHEQRAFWQFRSLALASTKQLTMETLQEYVRTAGADVGAFNACMGTGKPALEVQSDIAMAAQYSIQTVPTLFINSKYIRSDISANALLWEIFKAQLRQ